MWILLLILLFRSIDGCALVITRTCSWPIKMIHDHTIMKIYAQVFTNVYNMLSTIYHTEEDIQSFMEAMEDRKHEMRQVASETLALAFIGNTQNNPRTEGFSDNFRRLVHQIHCTMKGKLVIRYPGAKPEAKRLIYVDTPFDILNVHMSDFSFVCLE